MQPGGDESRTATQRSVTAAFGVLFILLAIGIVASAESSMFLGAVIAALAVGLLGIDGCVSAFRGKRSLLERIGPLP
jgi:hypothetical protein